MTGLVVGAVEITLAMLLLVLAVRMMTLAKGLNAVTTNGISSPFAPADTSSSAEPLAFEAVTASRNAFQRVTSQQSHRIESTSDLTAQLHIFASVQLLDVRRRDLELNTATPALKSLAAAYLYGAACALAPFGSDAKEKAYSTAVKVARRSLNINDLEAQQVLSTLTQSSSALYCFRNGLEGAEFWGERHYVPDQYSLYAALTANALI
ncbi:hypothetical protein ACTXGQ_08640 [Marinobacter sp. 1Y8]